MPRSPDVLEDPTPLESPVVNVGTRVGWLLRTTRLHTPGAAATASEFARQIGVPQTAVSAWEKGAKDPDAVAVGAYEQALGLTPGLLLATVAGLRREFGQPGRVSSSTATLGLREASKRVRPVLTGRASGAQWLDFALTLADGAVVLPDFVARPQVDRLVSELGRSVGDAFLPRQEALALLRTSAYDELVLEACLDHVAHPAVQVAGDAMAALGARPDRELLRTMSGLLGDPRIVVCTGACATIATMVRTRPGLRPEWLREVAPTVLAAYGASLTDPERHARLSGLMRQLPPGFVQLAREQGLTDPLPSSTGADDTTRQETWVLATEIALAVMERLEARPEPLLARTVYEALVDHESLRGLWARMVLTALPYRDLVASVVAGRVERCTPPQQDVLRILLSHLGAVGLARAEEQVAHGDPGGLAPALITVAHAASTVDEGRMHGLLVSPAHRDVRRWVLYAAGMTAAPALAEWVGDEDLGPEVRAGARWWLEQGGRIDDEPPTTSATR